MTFWHSATAAQKLAQVDAGISLDMTIRQIALASGAREGALGSFGQYHGRKFPSGKGRRSVRGEIVRKRNAYLRGEAVNFFGEVEADEFKLDQVEA
jgi:hypothetical protein